MFHAIHVKIIYFKQSASGEKACRVLIDSIVKSRLWGTNRGRVADETGTV